MGGLVRELRNARAAYYCSTWFRSRLEACWAAWLDEFGMAWDYEQRAVELEDGLRYMPDFWLPESKAWLEVKGIMDPESQAKVIGLSAAADKSQEVVILAGGPAGLVWGEVANGELNLGVDLLRCRVCQRWTFSFTACRSCGFLYPVRDASAAALTIGTFDESRQPLEGIEIVWGKTGPERLPWQYRHGVAARCAAGLEALTKCGLKVIGG